MNGPQVQPTEVQIVEELKYPLAKIDPIAEVVKGLDKRYGDVVYDVTTGKGMAVSKAARGELRGLRVDLEDARKAEKADILERGRYIDKIAKNLTTTILKHEEPIDILIKEFEEKRAAEKAARDEAEAKRKSAIQLRLSEIRNLAVLSAGKPSHIVRVALETAQHLEIDNSFQEFQQEAQEAIELVIDLLTSLLSETLAKEQEQARIQAERKDLERQKEIQAEKEREAERLRLEAEEEARQKRIAEEGRLEGIRLAQESKLAEERAKLEADRKAEEKAMANKRASEQRIIDSIQAIRDTPYHYDPATSSSESILIALRIVEKTVPIEQTFGRHLQDAVESVARAIKQLESLYTQALSRENREAQVKAELEEADRLRKEQERIEADNRRREEEITRKELGQKEKVESEALRCKLLAENRRETPQDALESILRICLDTEGHPDDKEARTVIALIAEGTLYPIETVPESVSEPVNHPPKKRGRKPKK